jgi:hypothetical protein
METTTRRQITRWSVAFAVALTTGCVTLPTIGSLKDRKPHGEICQAVATWQREVVFSPDPTRGGARTPGVAGRLYLFGQEIKEPLIAEGHVVVDLYDETGLAQGKPSVLLEQWRLDNATLKQLERRDAIGWGYNLYLPWGTYRPDIAQVRLRTRYEEPGSPPIYAEGPPIMLKGNGPVLHTAHRQVGTPR